MQIVFCYIYQESFKSYFLLCKFFGVLQECEGTNGEVTGHSSTCGFLALPKVV
jgi:hypothetical protein